MIAIFALIQLSKNARIASASSAGWSMKEALEAANAAFKENKSDDRFELDFGEGSTIVFPRPEKKIPEKK